ncbi:MAG: hypothetical protein ACLS37_12885 [Alistipes sp.]
MKKLSELLVGVPVLERIGPDDRPVGRLTYDSRDAGDGDCFFAVRRRHDFIRSRGASRRVGSLGSRGAYCGREYQNAAMADMAAFYSHQARAGAGRHHEHERQNDHRDTALIWYGPSTPGGLISTVVYRIDDQSLETTHTTPTPSA